MAAKRNFGAYKADLQKQESPYAFYGTPLPPLDDQVRDDGSFVPIWKQEVTDERGRKRLHGAFTGGWSAGYFNSVGSKEGWTPSTFVSSRTNRMKDSKHAVQQRPEDFMDEEDRREAEEAQKISTNEDFSGFGTADEVTRRGGLLGLFKTTGDTKGVQLLRRMGWRDGQGIGPKVRRKLRTDEGDDDDGALHVLAPEDPKLIAFVNKSDYKGLGYGGEAKLESKLERGILKPSEKNGSVSSDDEEQFGPAFSKSRSKKKSQNAKRRGAFGVGVLNDTGSDDEDPYEMGPKIAYNRTIGGDERKKKKEALGGSNPLLKVKPTFVSKKTKAAKSSSGFRKCHDERYPPEGFVLASQLDAFSMMSIDGDSLKPPEVPEEWKPSKSPLPGGGGARQEYISTADAARNSSMDAKSRAALLGEAPLPGKSVFDFLTPAARDRIAHVTGKTALPAALGEGPPPGFELSEEDKLRSLEDSVPQLDPDVALQALQRGIGGWMPYAEDESKRARYRAFLEIRAGLRQGLPEKSPNMSKDNWISEMNEFARAAEVFRPVSGMMASRFTSSSSQPQSTSDPSTSSTAESLLSKPAAKPEDPAEQAARLGMFGPMTRSVTNFYPTRLLCKRFNVRPPANVSFDPGDEAQSTTTNPASSGTRFQSTGFQNPSAELLSKDQIQQMLDSVTSSSVATPEVNASTPTVPEPQSTVVVDTERNEALEAERPGEAVFKAIFGSDDEDE